jgi:hypothetical protein
MNANDNSALGMGAPKIHAGAIELTKCQRECRLASRGFAFHAVITWQARSAEGGKYQMAGRPRERKPVSQPATGCSTNRGSSVPGGRAWSSSSSSMAESWSGARLPGFRPLATSRIRDHARRPVAGQPVPSRSGRRSISAHSRISQVYLTPDSRAGSLVISRHGSGTHLLSQAPEEAPINSVVRSAAQVSGDVPARRAPRGLPTFPTLPFVSGMHSRIRFPRQTHQIVRPSLTPLPLCLVGPVEQAIDERFPIRARPGVLVDEDASRALVGANHSK